MSDEPVAGEVAPVPEDRVSLTLGLARTRVVRDGQEVVEVVGVTLTASGPAGTVEVDLGTDRTRCASSSATFADVATTVAVLRRSWRSQGEV